MDGWRGSRGAGELRTEAACFFPVLRTIAISTTPPRAIQRNAPRPVPYVALDTNPYDATAPSPSRFIASLSTLSRVKKALILAARAEDGLGEGVEPGEPGAARAAWRAPRRGAWRRDAWVDGDGAGWADGDDAAHARLSPAAAGGDRAPILTVAGAREMWTRAAPVSVGWNRSGAAGIVYFFFFFYP